MTPKNQEKIITDRFGLAKGSNSQRARFYERAGKIILDAAIGRLLLSLSESKVAELELYLDSHSESDDVLVYLLQAYPAFEDYLEEEALAFQQEALQLKVATITS